jgi:hypothetical protein
LKMDCFNIHSFSKSVYRGKAATDQCSVQCSTLSRV